MFILILVLTIVFGLGILGTFTSAWFLYDEEVTCCDEDRGFIISLILCYICFSMTVGGIVAIVEKSLPFASLGLNYLLTCGVGLIIGPISVGAIFGGFWVTRGIIALVNKICDSSKRNRNFFKETVKRMKTN